VDLMVETTEMKLLWLRTITMYEPVVYRRD